MCSTWCVRVCVSVGSCKHRCCAQHLTFAWHILLCASWRGRIGKEQSKKNRRRKKWSCINAILASQPTHTHTHTSLLRWGTFHLLCGKRWATASFQIAGTWLCIEVATAAEAPAAAAAASASATAEQEPWKGPLTKSTTRQLNQRGAECKEHTRVHVGQEGCHVDEEVQ